MTTRLPHCSPRELIGVLEKAGFERRDGKHAVLRKGTHKIVISCHKRSGYGDVLLRKILREAELSEDDYRSLLK